MLTFSVNKTVEDIARVASLVDSKPTTEFGRQWLSEVWIKAIDDRVDDEVNVDAYGYACEVNTRKAKAKKETPLLTVEEVGNGLKGVADTVASYLDTNVDDIIESSEVRTLVESFLTMQEVIRREEGTSLWKVLSLARCNNVKMVNKLRDLIDRFNISELIEGVLKNRECLLTLEGVMA